MNSLNQKTHRNHKGITKAFGFLLSIFCLTLAGLLLPAERATAGDIELLVPAYANPCCGGGPMWANLLNTAQNSTVGLNVILNPASGPGASPIDPNYINPSGPDPLLDLTSAGGVVYGYVPTGFGIRNINDVKADVDTYYDPAYWRGAGVQVNGIFFDEMSNDLADVGYYQQIRDHVKSKDPTARVIANPGTTFTNNPSMQTTFTVTDYAESADTLVTFENTGNEYRNNYTLPSWLNDFTADHFAHIVHTEIADMLTDVGFARSRKAGMVYVTDDGLPNPYDTLASYWTDEVSAVEAHFSCVGFDPPMDKEAVTVKKNRALQHKAQLLDSNNNPITDLDLIAPPVIQVLFHSGTQPAVDVSTQALSARQGTKGNQFEFSGDKWQFNLITKNYTAVGTYTVTMVSGDVSEYVIDPTCVATFVIEDE